MKHPNAELLTIGNELLQGSTLNTNAQFLGRELTSLGFEVKYQSACQDHESEIKESLSKSWNRSDVIILTGGLGPTPDDLTRQAVSAFFRSPLRFSSKQFQMISRHYRHYGKKVPRLVRIEAYFPEIAVPLFNRYGIALGFYILKNEPPSPRRWVKLTKPTPTYEVGVVRKRLLIVLPGVPYELEKMFRELVKPLLKKVFPLAFPKYSLVSKFTGLSEPEVMKKLGRGFFTRPFEFGIYPEPSEVTVRIKAENPETIRILKRKIRRCMGSHLYSEFDLDLAATVGEKLKKKQKTIAVAESCTGGTLAALLTSHPGSSDYFIGSVTAYANAVKEKWLEVPARLIQKQGAVSAEVATAMAKRIREKMKSDFGIGVTGIAGPAGGSKTKPVGLVYLALSSSKKNKVWRHQFYGDRKMVQLKAAKKALEHLWHHLK